MQEFSDPPQKKLKTDHEIDNASLDTKALCDDGVEKELTDPEQDSDVEDNWRATETDVGITEYVSQLPGFSGILKQRYSDFLVNEIDPQDKVLHLTDVAEREEEKDDELEEQADESVLPGGCLDDLQQLAKSEDYSNNVLIEVGEDKDLRTSIHKAIRGLKMPLESTTETDSKGLRVIRVSKVKMKFGTKYVPPNRWPGSRPNYCHFLLYKENRDTTHAINMIAKALRVRASLFSYAGTKDKRAKTVQKVAAYRITCNKLLKLNKWWRQEIMLGNCSYQKEVLRLGDQNGNHFSIVLRDVSGSDEMIKLAVESLTSSGFINYFGMQRFGTSSTPTHKVGKALLKSNWAEAIDLILLSNPGVNTKSCRWREVWAETKDPSQTLDAMDRRHSVEKQLLEGMRRFGMKDFVNSLDTIPRNTRTMYVHSYQSFIWNTMVSSRLAKHGLLPMVGDLVLLSRSSRNQKDSGERDCPSFVTEENISEYSIYDVVLPLPGYDVQFPNNGIKDLYTTMLAGDDLKLEDFKHRVKDYSLPGAYRHVLVKPRDVTWEIFHYDDVTQALLVSDVDKLNNVEEPKSISDAKYKALKLEFSLPSSTYATMAVREMLKTDTSSAHQASLNT